MDLYVTKELNGCQVSEIGAWLTTWLAYPEADREAERNAQFEHLCSAHLQRQFANDPESFGRPQLIRPSFAFQNAATGRFGSKRLESRLRRALGRCQTK